MESHLRIGDRESIRSEDNAASFDDAELTSLPSPEREVFSSREVVLQYRGPALKCDALREPSAVARLVRKMLRDDSKEHFLAVFLDGRHRPIGHSVVSIGTATASLVHPREVFQPAIQLGAVALVVAHNHPSGDPKPSSEDEAVTKRLAEVGKLLGIQLLDSVVVTRAGDYHSFRETSPASFV